MLKSTYIKPAYLLASVFLFLFAGCDTSDPDEVEVEFRFVPDSSYTETASGLKYFDFIVGDSTGIQGDSSNLVLVHYNGWLEDETLFESTINDRSAILFVLGIGDTPAGIQEGLQGMYIGGERQLVVPPELAFGSAGAENVPPNATLIYDVLLVDMVEPLYDGPQFQEIADDDFTVTASGLKYFDFELGEGPAATVGDSMSVDYTGWLEIGWIFDTSVYAANRVPLPIELGVSSLISGWTEGLQGMREGGRRQLVIPPSLGYGSTQRSGIPPNSVLVFEVEVVKLTDRG